MWSYCIAERGEHFVNNRIPIEKYKKYISDINLWRLIKSQEKRSDEYLDLY